eukprot:9283391-Alexandrium_andersonii.AAC.1
MAKDMLARHGRLLPASLCSWAADHRHGRHAWVTADASASALACVLCSPGFLLLACLVCSACCCCLQAWRGRLLLAVLC